MENKQQNAADAIEELIDRSTLADFLDVVASICHEKSAHINSTWQDVASAELWNRMADRLATQAQQAKRYQL